MIEVTLGLKIQGQWCEVRAEVTKEGPGDYDVAWCDKGVVDGLTSAQQHYVRRRFEEAYDLEERARRARASEVQQAA